MMMLTGLCQVIEVRNLYISKIIFKLTNCQIDELIKFFDILENQ